ncbi:MAG TPA: lactate utilization protein C [Actinomycetales bacterium]|nr:lactate utilization protein C [Actinomycetales bacterium]
MNARDVVLARIKKALDADTQVAAVTRGYRGAGASRLSPAGLVPLLSERLTDYKARVHTAEATDLPQVVAAVLAGARSCVIPAGLDRAWTAGWEGAVGRVLVDEPAAPLTVEDLDRVDAVLTGARVAIAETGTIVLDGGRDQGRRALTLVPDRHICVVRADQVVAGVPDAVAVLDPVADGPRPLTWISGPSATSDIELQRVEGVHGPRTLEVILVASRQ